MDQETPLAPEAITPSVRPEGAADKQYAVAARAFQRFLGALGTLVSVQLCLPVEAGPVSVRQGSLADALTDGEPDGCVVAIDLKPFPGLAYLSFGRGLVSSTLEILLGAPLSFAGQPREYLTEVDLHVLDGLIDSAVGELRKAWAPVSQAAFLRVGTEAGPDAALAAADDTRMAILSAGLRVNDRPDRMRLILPEQMARLAGQARAEQTAGGVQTRAALAEALTLATVDVQAVLRGSDIRFRDLLRLRSGMVLALPHKAGAPMECQVNGVPKFRGEMIRSGSGAAMVVQSVVSGRE